jgi:hypothetical protein
MIPRSISRRWFAVEFFDVSSFHYSTAEVSGMGLSYRPVAGVFRVV